MDNNNPIIKMQRKYRTLRGEIKNLNYLISFLKDYFIGMISNLSYFNNIKLYQDTDSLFMLLLKELKEIKDNLDKFPDFISFKNLEDENNYYDKCNEIKNLMIKYSNHIASDNINYVLKLLLGEMWINNNSYEDLEKILFITRYIKPISVWDSEYHKEEVPIISVNNDSSSLKKSSTLTREIIDSLLGIIPKNPANTPIMEDKNNMKINSVIINPTESSAPTFLKTINDLIEMNNKKSSIKRNNSFNYDDANTILGDENIKIVKNAKSTTLIEDKSGACIYIKCLDKIIVIQGLFRDDLLNNSFNIKFVKAKVNSIKGTLAYDILHIPKIFKENYVNTLSLRDIIVSTNMEIAEDIKKKHNDFKSLQIKPLLALINEFLLASKYRKIDILTLLLMSNEDDRKIAFILFDVFKAKDKKDVSTEVYQSLHHSIRELLDASKVKVEKEEQELGKLADSDIPYERRIGMMNIDDNVKSKAMEKLKAMKSSFQGDSKAQAWLDGLLKLPFNTYSMNEIINFKDEFTKRLKLLNNKVYRNLFSDSDIDNYIGTLNSDDSSALEWSQYKVDKRNYLKDVRATLDSVVYGHKEAKVQLERLFAQWINGESKGAVLGLQGPPGTGKTSLAKLGLSKCLKDKNGKPRPFAFLPIGGSVNGSTLVGHNFTYVGSMWGRIADILMTTECMNPIIFIDEVDKVSHTEHGREIISILTHLTDATQNDEFEDKFFSGIKLDLSKALIVFSFNDPDLIDPILRDRITIIETHPLSIKEKITIINDYMFPEICKDVGFNKEEIILSEDMIRFLIETYTNEAGVRKIKEKIVEIIRDINLNRFINNDYIIPYTITKEYVERLFENKPRIRNKKVHPEPTVGLVNGLYATTSGIGGLTKIQLTKFPSEKMLDLQLTGKAGDVMKESVQYSLKVAWTLLTIEEQNKLIEDSHDKKSFGIHVHCPDGATPKDGPSAGAAFTLAIYSLITNKKVNNKVCMTGEIDLCGDVTAIGGVQSKLTGGKKAGCTLALIPEENWEDLEKMRREGLSPEDETFEVKSISNIREVIRYAIV